MNGRRRAVAAAAVLLLTLFWRPLPAPGVQTGEGRPSPQKPRQKPPEVSPEEEEEVVRVTTNLVQIDAVVTDGRGVRVGDLRAEDFEVVAGGRRQQITNFSYVSGAGPEAATPTPRAAAGPATGAPAQPPPQPLRRPAQARRTVALVVDNLCTSAEDTHHARDAIRKFVNEEMRPGDLVAVLQTLGGAGAMQQFTTDKRLLLAAAGRVRYNTSPSRAYLCEADALSPISGPPVQLPPPPGNSPSNPDALPAPSDDGRENYRAGRFATLSFILRGLREMPGRKAFVLLTDNLPSPRPADGGDSKRKLDGLVDLAARGSVVVYTVDLRGLPTFSLSAADSPRTMTPQQVEGSLKGRSAQFHSSQGGMEYLAHETGGFFTRNTNDIPSAIRGALEDQQGYYLIGFRPDAEMFDPESGRVRFNGVRLKVRRAGLRIRTRGGFYGYADEESRRDGTAKPDLLYSAAASPFAAADVGLGLTSLFRDEAGRGPTLRALLHIDLSKLTFEDEPDGWRKTSFEVFAVIFDADGAIAEKESRTETVRAKGQTLARLLRDGLVYSMSIPAKKPGVYQLRVAVRDTATEKLGSAGQLVEVPRLEDGRLALSGLVVQGADPRPAQAVGEAEPPDLLRGPALRQFRRGAEVDYFYDIYNAKLDPATGRPRLRTRVLLLRDGKPVFNGDELAYEPTAQADVKRLAAASRIVLGTDLAPGDYVLQVVVTDALAKEGRRVATQWVDFRVVE